MSEFDVIEATFADDLIVHGGDVAAVLLDSAAGPQPFDAIVGRLRQEEIIVGVGELEKRKHVDICQVSIRCAPGRVALKNKLTIKRYTTGDESGWPGQLFSVSQLVSVTAAWTTVEARRRSLAVQQRSGTEA